MIAAAISQVQASAAQFSQALAAEASQPNPNTISAIPGMPTALATCIAWRESSSTAGATSVGNAAANGNAYGIIPASGYNVAGMSIAQQNQIAAQLYAQHGGAPWLADGCPGT